MRSFTKLQVSTRRFLALIFKKIRNEQNIEKAFLLSEWSARFLFLNRCGIYRCDFLEQVLIKKITHKITLGLEPKKTELHVASEIYSHGGHTRLLQTLVKNSLMPVDVLFTRVGEHQSFNFFDACGGHVFKLQSKSAIDSVQEICNTLSQYEKIIVHIHPDDIICSVALSLLKRHRPEQIIVFINHSDHAFSVGLESASVVYELSMYGWALRDARRTNKKSSFIGIPITPEPFKPFALKSEGLILSGGASFKFKPSLGVSLPRIIDQMLGEIPNARVLIIGPKPLDYWWWALRVKYRGRIMIREVMPHADYLDFLQKTAVYVDSLPVTGGTGFTEALINGANISGVIGPVSGYGLSDMLSAPDVEGFLNTVRSLIENDPVSLQKQETARLQAKSFHSVINVRKRLDKSIQRKICFSPPKELIPTQMPLWFEREWQEGGKVLHAGFRRRAELFSIFFNILDLSLQSKSFAVVRLANLFLKATKAIFRH